MAFIIGHKDDRYIIIIINFMSKKKYFDHLMHLGNSFREHKRQAFDEIFDKMTKKRMWRKIKNAFEFEPFYESTKNWNMNIVRHVPGRVNMIQIKLVEFLTCYLFCGILYLKKRKRETMILVFIRMVKFVKAL